MRRSVLFISPDYHNSFTLAAALRRRGWRAAVLAPNGYDPRLLYSDDVIRQWSFGNRRGRLGVTANILLSLVQYVFLSIYFRHHVTYGRMFFPVSYESEFARLGWCGEEFHIGLQVSKMLGVKHVYIPSGCRDEDLKSVFNSLKGEAMCSNCGFFNQCSDQDNRRYVKRASRYSDAMINWGFYGSSIASFRAVRYKCLDFDRWSISRRPADQRIVVLHSHATESRNLIPGRNIKGTPIIDEVMKRICSRYPHVEYRRVTGLKMTEMLVEQQSADVVIDQLFIGHWGSTGIEAMGVGCAVVCYIRPEWAEQFKRSFPSAPTVPVISATKDTLEEQIEALVTNPERLRMLQDDCRKFAEVFYDPVSVSAEFEELLLGLGRSRN